MDNEENMHHDSLSLQRRLLRLRQQQIENENAAERVWRLQEATRRSMQQQEPTPSAVLLAQHQALLAQSRTTSAVALLTRQQLQASETRFEDMELALRLSEAHLARRNAVGTNLFSQPPHPYRTDPSQLEGATSVFLPRLNSLHLLHSTVTGRFQSPTRVSSKRTRPHEDLLARTKQNMVRKDFSRMSEPKAKSSKTKWKLNDSFPLPPLSEEGRRPTCSKLESYAELWKKLKANKELFLRHVQRARIPILRDTSIMSQYSRGHTTAVEDKMKESASEREKSK